MAIANWFSRVTEAPVLMERMMARFGVRERLRARVGAAEVTRRAALRCTGCGDKTACAEWLADGAEAAAVPGFCRNSALIERLRRVTD